MTDYDKEKRELIKKCKEFLESHNNYVSAPLDNNKVMLFYVDEKVETIIDAMYFENGYDDNDNEILEVYVTSFSEVYPDGTEYDKMSDFGNDEIKDIMRIFGIKV